MSKQADVIVVGGGWAGLAAAVTLTQQGKSVQLIEAASHLGGRARKVELADFTVDNGHHLFVGAYQHLLALLNSLNVDANTVFKRKPFSLNMFSATGNIKLPSSTLPAPFNLLSSLMRASNISAGIKFRALVTGLALRNLPASLHRDLSVAEVFNKLHYPKKLTDNVWAPLCLAICNTQIDNTSAQNFFTAIQQTFFVQREYSDILYPRKNLSEIFPEHASAYLKKHSVKISLKQRVKEILIEDGIVYGIKTNDTVIPAQQVILAVTPPAVAKLLNAGTSCQALITQLAQITYAPICTLYMQYPGTVKLPSPMLGFTDKISQWIFDRQYDDQSGLVAVIISGNGPHEKLSQEDLTMLVTQEIAEVFPDWPAPLKVKVLWEKRATFICQPGINSLRPEYKTDIKGLWLAGDFTQTGLPATLEGAVQSGVQCAQQLIKT